VVPPIGSRAVQRAGRWAIAFPPTSPPSEFAENMAGHITWQLDGQNGHVGQPRGDCGGPKLTASDICAVDADARGGARSLGTSLRAIHNPYRTAPSPRRRPGLSFTITPTTLCVLAALGQAARAGAPDRVRCSWTTCAWSIGTTAKIETPRPAQAETRGTHRARQSDDPDQSRRHRDGVATLPEAVYRAASIERVCKLAYDVMLTGREPVADELAGHGGHATVAH